MNVGIARWSMRVGQPGRLDNLRVPPRPGHRSAAGDYLKNSFRAFFIPLLTQQHLLLEPLRQSEKSSAKGQTCMQGM